MLGSLPKTGKLGRTLPDGGPGTAGEDLTRPDSRACAENRFFSIFPTFSAPAPAHGGAGYRNAVPGSLAEPCACWPRKSKRWHRPDAGREPETGPKSVFFPVFSDYRFFRSLARNPGSSDPPNRKPGARPRPTKKKLAL